MLVDIVHGYDSSVEVIFNPAFRPGKVLISLHFPKTRGSLMGKKENPYPIMYEDYSLRQVYFAKKKTQTEDVWITTYGPFKPPKGGDAWYRIKWPTYGETTNFKVTPGVVMVSHFSMSASVPLV
jgi:hypothetical protein